MRFPTKAARWQVVVLSAIPLLAGPNRASAQSSPQELGFDGAISFARREAADDLPSSTVQAWAFPLQRIRMGRWASQRFQVQLSTAFSVADFGEISTVRFALGIAGIYHLTDGGPRSGPFVSLGTGFDLLSNFGTDIQWSGAAGLGIKVPMGRYFAFRPAIEVSRSLRSDRRLAENTITGLFGVSVFTKQDGAGQ